MNRLQLIQQIEQKRSYLCVGLDTDITKIPKHLRSHPNAVFEFNKQIIDATKDLCVTYKINTAFYEALGLKGWEALEQTVNYIPKDIFTIADAKRGDIGNTSAQYAKAFFETLNFDAITVAPYMGEDSVKPFLEYDNKWTIVLGLTSNAGSKDFEQLNVVGQATNNHESNAANSAIVGRLTNNEEFLYERVLRKVSEWGTPNNLMFVIGATKAKDLEHIRKIIPEHFLLVPGVGTQGGSLEDVSKYGMNKDRGLLVNASRAIIFAGENENFAEEARKVAQEYQKEMSKYFTKA
jgi:orotidine-5'-phosphate decarboxylase